MVVSTNLSAPFRVDETSGEIVLTGSLDFEMFRFHVFTVNATDGEFTDEALVTVNVFDFNDHTPEFQQDVYSVSVDEGNYTLTPRPLLMVSLSSQHLYVCDSYSTTCMCVTAIVPPVCV